VPPCVAYHDDTQTIHNQAEICYYQLEACGYKYTDEKHAMHGRSYLYLMPLMDKFFFDTSVTVLTASNVSATAHVNANLYSPVTW